MSKAEAVRKFITENNISDHVPNRTIAQRLYNENPDYWGKLDATRNMVRYVRGNYGKSQIKVSINTGFARENRTPLQAIQEYNLNPVDISIQDYVLQYKKPLILSDIHFPYHDIDALTLSVEHGVKNDIDCIYLNGDVLDMYQVSRFMRDPKMMSLSDERDMFLEFVMMLKSEVNVPIVFKMGNHEERWEHYIKRQAPELYGMNEFLLKSVLKLDEHGIKFVSGRQKAYFGKLLVIHGHEFGESIFSPVNPARGLFLKAKCSVLAGHNHQTSSHHENNLKGDSMACFSTGCLSQMTPEYRPFAYTKWNHGFAIVEIDNDGSFHVDNLRIVNGKVS